MEIVAVLDMSGSMEPLENDTIGGFNAYVNEMKQQQIEVRMTLIVFNVNSRTVYAHVPIKDVPSKNCTN